MASMTPAVAQQKAGSQQTKSESEASSHQASASVKERLEFLLSAYHGAPTAEQLDAVGDAGEVAAWLRAIAADQATRPSLKLRAIDSLGHFDDHASIAFLERAIETPSALEERGPRHAQLLRQHAILSFAQIRGEAAVPTLVRFVGTGADGSDLQLGLTAISALGRFGGQTGRAKLEQLRTRVEHPVLKRSLNKLIGPTAK